jgi:predicted SprT family Zn-dependent metalloprotease
MFPEFHKIQITQTDAEKLLKKLTRHFKTHMPRLEFNTRHPGRGIARHLKVNPGYTYSITLNKNPYLNVVTHEFSHLLANKKYNKNCKHTKKFMKTLKQVNNYVLKKNYFNCKDTKLELSLSKDMAIIIDKTQTNSQNVGLYWSVE